jgi:trans-2,3-dihydro-3-hydroxyanthranilate isomerase
VFTDRRFAGNPLAVVLDAGALDAPAMQAIAREFNYPETVFVFPSEAPRHRARVRIFTPARELLFAGHPTVGTAVLLALRDGAAAGGDLVLEEGIGPVRCRIERAGGGHGCARFELAQLPAEAGAPADDAAIAGALAIPPAEIGFRAFRPARWSAGVPVTFVPLARLDTIRGLRPDAEKLVAALGEGPVYAFCGEGEEAGHTFHARMFAPAMGVREDPATGAAAAALAGLLAAHGGYRDGEHAVVIEQGYEMGRPSLIRLAMTLRSGRLAAASIAGDAVVVTEGTIEA